MKRLSIIASLVGIFCFTAMGCVATEDDELGSSEDEIRIRTKRPAPAPPTSSTPSTSTLRIVNGELHDRCGERVVLRGVNKDIVALDRQGNSLSEIAKTGANTVRMVWLASVNPAEAELPLSRAVSNGLIPIWELHDATGNIWMLPKMVDYWVRPDTVRLIQKYQSDLIINIANEAGDWQVTDAVFESMYKDAIRRMRAAGIRTPILIDGARWAQDVEQVLRVGARIFDSDPDRNIIFSWHEYSGGSGETNRITNVMEAAKRAKLPLIVGEFAQLGPECQWNVPYKHIMSEAERLGIGWIAWSWDSTNGHCLQGTWSGFNMTGDGVHLSTLAGGWPQDVVYNHPASLTRSSKRTHWQTARACK